MIEVNIILFYISLIITRVTRFYCAYRVRTYKWEQNEQHQAQAVTNKSDAIEYVEERKKRHQNKNNNNWEYAQGNRFSLIEYYIPNTSR